MVILAEVRAVPLFITFKLLLTIRGVSCIRTDIQNDGILSICPSECEPCVQTEYPCYPFSCCL